jgi:hypothetical protein
MAYSYDRKASDKTWYDMLSALEGMFMGKVVAELAHLVKGKGSTGAFGSGSVVYGAGTVRLGFKGGEPGTVYVIDTANKRDEYSVVNHTPESFARLLVKRGIVTP